MTYRHLSNDSPNCEFVAVGHDILKRKLVTLQVGDLVRLQLPLPLLLHVRVVLAIILWINEANGLVILEVRDDIAPSLVIVDAQSDDAALTFIGQEAKGAGRSAAVYLEHVASVDIAPGSTFGEIPRCLLDDTEELILVGISLEDQHVDLVTHFCD